MSAARRRPRGGGSRPDELEDLRARLAEAQATLDAIRHGEVDAVVVAGREGTRVFTLDGAGDAYRALIESMNEGALTLSADKTVLYANGCFARMVGCPLRQVIGGSFRRFLSATDLARFRPLVRRPARGGSKILVRLRTCRGAHVPAQISIRRFSRAGPGSAAVGMVVTELSEARRTEERLRALIQRVVQVQETERGLLAAELHDHITQLLCAVLFRSQALADSLDGRNEPARRQAIGLRTLLARTAGEVERISRGLRPSVLEQLGIAAVLRSTGREFAERTGLSVRTACVALTARLPGDGGLALFRILQEALRNVERHARASRVTVRLTRHGQVVRMSVRDDGVGFDAARPRPRSAASRGLGLLTMGERADSVGGALSVRSAPGRGTTIQAEVPCGEPGPPGERAARAR